MLNNEKTFIQDLKNLQVAVARSKADAFLSSYFDELQLTLQCELQEAQQKKYWWSRLNNKKIKELKTQLDSLNIEKQEWENKNKILRLEKDAAVPTDIAPGLIILQEIEADEDLIKRARKDNTEITNKKYQFYWQQPGKEKVYCKSISAAQLGDAVSDLPAPGKAIERIHLREKLESRKAEWDATSIYNATGISQANSDTHSGVIIISEISDPEMKSSIDQDKSENATITNKKYQAVYRHAGQPEQVFTFHTADLEQHQGSLPGPGAESTNADLMKKLESINKEGLQSTLLSLKKTDNLEKKLGDNRTSSFLKKHWDRIQDRYQPLESNINVLLAPPKTRSLSFSDSDTTDDPAISSKNVQQPIAPSLLDKLRSAFGEIYGIDNREGDLLKEIKEKINQERWWFSRMVRKSSEYQAVEALLNEATATNLDKQKMKLLLNSLQRNSKKCQKFSTIEDILFTARHSNDQKLLEQNCEFFYNALEYIKENEKCRNKNSNTLSNRTQENNPKYQSIIQIFGISPEDDTNYKVIQCFKEKAREEYPKATSDIIRLLTALYYANSKYYGSDKKSSLFTSINNLFDKIEWARDNAAINTPEKESKEESKEEGGLKPVLSWDKEDSLNITPQFKDYSPLKALGSLKVGGDPAKQAMVDAIYKLLKPFQKEETYMLSKSHFQHEETTCSQFSGAFFPSSSSKEKCAPGLSF